MQPFVVLPLLTFSAGDVLVNMLHYGRCSASTSVYLFSWAPHSVVNTHIQLQ